LAERKAGGGGVYEGAFSYVLGSVRGGVVAGGGVVVAWLVAWLVAGWWLGGGVVVWWRGGVVARLRAERASFQHPFSSSRYKKLLASDGEAGSSGVPRLKADYLIPNGWDDDRS
jgi:hypothetical protein